jgi:hypothetical protein
MGNSAPCVEPEDYERARSQYVSIMKSDKYDPEYKRKLVHDSHVLRSNESVVTTVPFGRFKGCEMKRCVVVNYPEFCKMQRMLNDPILRQSQEKTSVTMKENH